MLPANGGSSIGRGPLEDLTASSAALKKPAIAGLSHRFSGLLKQAANGIDRVGCLIHVLLVLWVGVNLCLGVVAGIAAAFVCLCQGGLIGGSAQRIALGIGGIDVCLQVPDLLLAGGSVVGVTGVVGGGVCSTQSRRKSTRQSTQVSGLDR